MNTLGGTAGLAIYVAVAKHAKDAYLDWFILVSGTLVLLVTLYLRVFVFIVRY